MAATRGAKRAALFVASAMLTLVPATTAHATGGTLVGPADITGAGTPMSTQGTVFNTVERAGSAGIVTSWSANFNCSTSPCGQARLVVLADTGNSSVYDITSTSAWEDVSGSGVQTFSSSAAIVGAGYIAVETDGPAVRYISNGSEAVRTQSGALGNVTQVNTNWYSGFGTQAQINAEMDPKTATTTSVTTNPTVTTAGQSVTYTAHVAEDMPGDPEPPVTGNVEFKDGSTTVPGCGSVALVSNIATCTTTAGERGYHSITGNYLGDSGHMTSTGFANLRVTVPSTVTPVANPNPVARRASITYTASVSPLPYVVSSAGTSNSPGYGTVKFYVDGEVVNDCEAQPVTSQGVATCVSTAPARSGSHPLHVEYSGGAYNGAASGDGTFDVIAPDISAPAVDFGGVTVGQTATRTVTFTNHEDETLAITGDALTGSSLAITGDGCTNTTLAAGASCDVTVAYKPADTSAVAGAVTLTDETGGTHTGALAGHGVAVPVATPTPVPPKPATFAPGSSSQLTVSVTTPSDGGTPQATVNVPLSCPAQQTCDLDGNIQITTADFAKAAHAAAASTTTVARFSKVSIAAGKVKTIKLHLSPSFIKKAQKAGVRRIHAVLTVHTTLGNGTTLTSQQHITVILPRAAKKKAAPKAKPHFTG